MKELREISNNNDLSSHYLMNYPKQPPFFLAK